MTWHQFLARDLVWPYTYRAPKPTDDEGEVSFADYIGDDQALRDAQARAMAQRFQREDDEGWTPEVPSILHEEPPPRVPIIPDPPRPVEYRDQQYWDQRTAALADEAVAWLRHADDLAMRRNDLPRAKKRRNQQIARLRKAVAATPLPSQVTT